MKKSVYSSRQSFVALVVFIVSLVGTKAIPLRGSARPPSRSHGALQALSATAKQMGAGYHERGAGDGDRALKAAFGDTLNTLLNKPLPRDFACLEDEYAVIRDEYLDPKAGPHGRDFAEDYERIYDVSHVECDELQAQSLKRELEAEGVGDAFSEAVRLTAESARLRLLVNAVNRYLQYQQGDSTKLSTFRSELRAQRPHMMEAGSIMGRATNPKEAIMQYKIHLMPQDDDLENVVLRLAWLIRGTTELNRDVMGFKIVCLPFEYASREEMPRIVIYVGGGKEAAQRVLNAMYDAFCDLHGRGLPYAPRFNEKITNFLYAAQGHGNDKNMWKRQIEILESTGLPFEGFARYSIDPSILRDPNLVGVFPFRSFPYEDRRMVYYKGSINNKPDGCCRLVDPKLLLRRSCSRARYSIFCHSRAQAAPSSSVPSVAGVGAR